MYVQVYNAIKRERRIKLQCNKNIKLNKVKKASIYKATLKALCECVVVYNNDHVDVMIDMYVCSVEDLLNNLYR